MTSKNRITVLVMFECKNRKLTLPEDTKLGGLIKEFMHAFKDVIPPNVAPTQFLFQKFDPHYQEWVDITEDEPILDGEKIRVIIVIEDLPIEEWTAATVDHILVEGDRLYLDALESRSIPDAETLSLNYLPDTPLPGVHAHRITDATYRIWSLVSRSNSSLMKRDGTTMNCSGNLTDEANLLNIQTKEDGPGKEKLYRLELEVPNDPSKMYLVTGQGENQDVEVQEVDASSPPNTTNTKFEPQYFYSFTLFRCQNVNGENDLYLASDQNGKLTLAKNGPEIKYPNPATLFICYQ